MYISISGNVQLRNRSLRIQLEDAMFRGIAKHHLSVPEVNTFYGLSVKMYVHWRCILYMI